MGRYHNPAGEIPTIGRELPREATTFNDLQSELQPGETLIGFGDRLLYQFAQLTETQSQLDDLKQQYSSGSLLDLRFFAVPSEKVVLDA